uniref:G-protein coupled receptors family 1 profile domain-containing protein n=1 Tax=Romanomermis culicivorax TaxID=13658 RepID=A0A915JQN5_ROMCU
MFNISHSEDSICSAEQTSLLSFLLAMAFIIGAICGLITNCVNLKILTHKRYPTTTLSIYLIVLCFTDMAALLINILLSEILVIAEWSKSIAFTNFWYKAMLVLYPMILIAVSTSVLIICALSIHYLIRIASPIKCGGNQIPKRRICLVVILTIAFAILASIPSFFELEIKSCYNEQANSVQSIFMKRQLDPIYRTLTEIWRLLLQCLIPYSLLITISILIFIEAKTPIWTDDGCNRGNASDETRQFLPASLSNNRNHQKRIEIRQHSTVLTIMFSYVVSSLPWSIAQLWLIYPSLYFDALVLSSACLSPFRPVLGVFQGCAHFSHFFDNAVLPALVILVG